MIMMSMAVAMVVEWALVASTEGEIFGHRIEAGCRVVLWLDLEVLLQVVTTLANQVIPCT